MTASTGKRQSQQGAVQRMRAFLAAEYGCAAKAADLIPELNRIAPHIRWSTARVHNEASVLGLTRDIGKDDARGPLSHADRDHVHSLALERAGVRFLEVQVHD